MMFDLPSTVIDHISMFELLFDPTWVDCETSIGAGGLHLPGLLAPDEHGNRAPSKEGSGLPTSPSCDGRVTTGA
jgi:hypothetical protein